MFRTAGPNGKGSAYRESATSLWLALGTQYLNAIARFHNYSFRNIMLIARYEAET